jgi:hypothetical protein
MPSGFTYLIERNTVFASGVNPDGIVLWASDPLVGINDSTVRRNRIVLDGSDFAGISLIGGGARNSFTQNVIEGSGAFALGLVADFFAPDTVAQANAFAGNQISHFNPRESSVYGFATHVFFDAHSRANVFVGNSRSVVDFGQDNSVTGLRQPAQPAGPTLSAALAARRSLMSHVRP